MSLLMDLLMIYQEACKISTIPTPWTSVYNCLCIKCLQLIVADKHLHVSQLYHDKYRNPARGGHSMPKSSTSQNRMSNAYKPNQDTRQPLCYREFSESPQDLQRLNDPVTKYIGTSLLTWITNFFLLTLYNKKSLMYIQENY